MPLLALAAGEVPDAGLHAEGKGQWGEAIRVYRQTLKADPGQVHLWVRIADIQARLGNPQAAAAALGEAIRHAPNDAGLHFRLSQTHAAAKTPGPALDAIERAVQLDGKNLEYLRARAILANWNQDLDKALDSYTRILVLAPNDLDAALGQARSHVWKGELDKAAPSYRAYLAKQPRDPAALMEYADVETRHRNHSAALEALDVYRQRFGGDLQVWVRTAEIQAASGNPHAAAEAMQQAVQYAPNDAKLHSQLSQARAAAKEGLPALAAINRAVELDPGNPDYLRARGELASWNADYAAAQDSYARLLAIMPGDPDATLGLARASLHKGDDDSAAKSYRAYLEKRPADQAAMMEYIELEGARSNSQAAREYGEIYRQRFGESMDYWLRMADIHALAGNDRASAEALQQATRYGADDPKLFFRLAQAYPTVEEAKHASAAIDRAVELDPKNLEYLRTRADLAAWRGDYDTSLDSYRRILAIAPDDAGATLGIARASYWKGDTGKAAREYRAYLDQHPEVQVAWIEYIQVVTELGNYASAVELLEAYRQRFGETVPYRKQKARVLAWADRPTPSLDIVSSLYPSMPNDYDLAYTRTIALNSAHRPREALASLEELSRLHPDSKETADLRRMIRASLRSDIRFSLGYRTDSDDVTISHAGLDGVHVISPETRVVAGADRQWLRARSESGFEKPDGGTHAAYSRVWAGASHLVSPRWAVDGQAGIGTTEGEQRLVYQAGANFQARDEFGMRLARSQDLYAVSPRATALGIQRRANSLDLLWAPDLRYTVAGLMEYDTFSDGNHRWEVDLAPRRAFLRSQRLNLDLGIGGRWFGFRDDPNHGYYAPSLYRRYSLTAYSYWKLSDDDGISVTFSAGPYKDNTLTGYRVGGDLAVEGIFGIYRDWMLDVKISLSHYGGGDTGAFRSRMFELSLTKRF